MTPETLLALAGQLPECALRAVLAIGDDYTMEGSPGPKRRDAYSLWWGRAGKHKLVTRPLHLSGGRFSYRLTPLGIELRDYLRARASAANPRGSVGEGE